MALTTSPSEPSAPTNTNTKESPSPTNSKSSLETASTAVNDPLVPSPAQLDFAGDIKTDNTLPTLKTLKKIENLPVLDEDGKAVPFKNLYTGPNVPRRVLVIFIRHFFCGNCQEYIRTLTSSISPSALLSLPTPSFIVIIGHGDPSLIPMYRSATSCPFPIYADPTKNLYSTLGMSRTLNLGTRPEYQRKDLLSLMVGGFVQSIRNLKGGKALRGGDYYQVGGEFLFEPLDFDPQTPSPMESPEKEEQKRLGEQGMWEMGKSEEKIVTWCHRMRNTRDHAEIPELREVLGLDGCGEGEGEKELEVPRGVNEKRWRAALLVRKGTGLSVGGGKGRESVSGNESRKGDVGL